MAYTPLLGLSLPVTGTLSGTWGDEINNSITSLLDSSVAGTTTLSTDADVTLTTTTGSANQARAAVLLCTGARTGVRYITAPAQSKTYTVVNATTGGFDVYIRGVGPTAGIAVPSGYAVQVAWNSSDFVQTSVPVTKISGLGTGVATALAIAVGTAGSPVVNGGALGTPSSGTVTNLTGTASININGTVGATTPAAVSATSLTDSGNLTFTGTGNRITGDFSNATLASRVIFQSSTVNARTIIGAIPNGTGTGATFAAYGSADPTNSSRLSTFIDTGTSQGIVASDITGTGTYLPMTFYTSGSEKLRIAADTTGTYTFQGTAPRITGDFSNATIANRVAFQSSTTNGNTSLGFIPNGTSTTSGINLFGGTDVANASIGQIVNTGGEVRIAAQITGTGTYLPMIFYIGGSERVRVDTSGNVGIGTTSPAQKLNIASDGYNFRTSNAANTFGYNLGRSVGDGLLYFYGDQSGANGYVFSGINGERMRIDSSGNVLINTTTARGQLTISQDASTGTSSYIVNANAGSNTTKTASWYFAGTDTVGNFKPAAYILSGPNDANYVTSYLAFGTRISDATAERMRIDSSGNVTVSTAALLGYGTGSGGTVTQATSKATSVTLNKPTGQITMFNNPGSFPTQSSIAAGASVIFNLVNSLLGSTDSIIVQPNFGTNSQGYIAQVTFCGSGGAYIRVTNITGGSLSEAVTLSFAVIKGATV